MHIGMIIDGLVGGGAEKVVLTLARALAERGESVTLVNLRAAQAYPIPVGVELITLCDNYRGPLRRQLEIGRRAKQLDQALRQRFGAHPFDLVISNLPKTDRIVAATPCLQHAWFCLHGAVIQTQLAARSGLQYYLKRRQLLNTYRDRKLILVSPGLKQDLALLGLEHFPHRVEIANPFDIAHIRHQAQQPCPLDGQDFLVHMGRFHPVKRHDRLLRAVKLSGYSGQLALIGSGSSAEEQAIRQQLVSLGMQQQVTLLGFIDNPYPYLRSARALVLSSDSEGFGNVLVEALACGTPVVSTRCPYGPESILQGELANGLCDLTESSLAEGITRILAAPPQLQNLDLSRFELATITERYLELAHTPERAI